MGVIGSERDEAYVEAIRGMELQDQEGRSSKETTKNRVQ